MHSYYRFVSYSFIILIYFINFFLFFVCIYCTNCNIIYFITLLPQYILNNKSKPYPQTTLYATLTTHIHLYTSVHICTHLYTSVHQYIFISHLFFYLIFTTTSWIKWSLRQIQNKTRRGKEDVLPPLPSTKEKENFLPPLPSTSPPLPSTPPPPSTTPPHLHPPLPSTKD